MAKIRPTQFNLARLSRRTGGLDRLAGEYKSQIAALTEDYTKSFAQYQSRVSEQMTPYEAAMKQYQEVVNPQYQTAMSEYGARLDAYRKQLQELEASPYATVTPTYDPRATAKVGGQFYQGDFRVNGMLINDFLASVGSPTRVTLGKYQEEGLRYGQPFSYLKPTPAKFTEQAPEAPETPVAPEVEQFQGGAQFEEKRAQLGQTLQREVAERKASRLQATRRSSRTMLGGQ